MTLLIAFIIAIGITVFSDSLVIVSCRKQKSIIGRRLKWTCIFAGCVCVSFTLALLNQNYFAHSALSSLYFISVDWMLVALCMTIRSFVEDTPEQQKKIHPLMKLAFVVMGLDMLVYLINPFAEIAISYLPQVNGGFVWYRYDMKFLYDLHLAFSYILVCADFYMLIRKMMKVPGVYRRPYYIVMSALLIISALNALYLFVSSHSLLNCFDFSICTYSLAGMVVYWCFFKYIPFMLPDHLKSVVVNSLDQAIVLFDYQGNIILTNDKAKKLLPQEALADPINAHQRFRAVCGIIQQSGDNKEIDMIQCYPNGVDLNPLRCDSQRLVDKKKRDIGHLYVFTNASPERDLITGFHSWDRYNRDYRDGKEPVSGNPITVTVCDISDLSEISTQSGNTKADHTLYVLSGIIRRYAPRGTYFLRGPETTMISICPNTNEKQAKQYMENVAEQYAGSLQYALCQIGADIPSSYEAIQTATHAIRNKQLLDSNSTRSDSLFGLIHALKQVDSDTEAHVQRTRRAGMLLGRRLGLNDVEMSNLNLLCLLHDIGKIAVPLEILNKPGKLSEDEWKIIQSHTRKGYEIARASSEISHLADMILHHHERWDGNGYPDRLQGENIPLLSRIIAVVDAYDAMISNRSYRNAMSPEKARDELKKQAGSQFDPHVAEVFIGILETDPEAFNTRNQGPAYLQNKPEEPERDAMMQMEKDAPEYMAALAFTQYTLDVNYRIIRVGDRFEELTGYTAEDIKTEYICQLDLIPKEDRTVYNALTVDQLRKYGKAFMKHRLLRKDGSMTDVLCYGRAYYDSANRAERSEIIVIDTGENTKASSV